MKRLSLFLSKEEDPTLRRHAFGGDKRERERSAVGIARSGKKVQFMTEPVFICAGKEMVRSGNVKCG